MIMEALYFVLLQFNLAILTESQFSSLNRTVFSQLSTKLDRVKRDTSPEELVLHINDEKREIFDVHFKRTDQLLANLHLPIWSVRKIANEPRFHEELEVMNEVGEFTMYHDYLSKSAAIYFHQTGHLHGVIDVRYYIHGLPISVLPHILNVNDKYIFERAESAESSPNRNAIFSRISQYDIGMLAKKFVRSVDQERANRRSRSPESIMYHPELLVVIGYDVFNSLKNINKNAQELRNILMRRQNKLSLSDAVSYVLSFYNAADMLYGLIENYKIKLNIAAIVIEVDQGALHFLEKPLRIRTPLNDALLANPVLINLMTGFEKLDHKFPTDSYDFIIYTTTHKLTKVCPGLNRKPTYYRGFTSSNLVKHPNQVQNFKHTSIIIRDDTQFTYFITVAHELAHAMTADHDPIKYTEHGVCDSYIMTSSIDRCPCCLRWSEKTKKALGNYFRSPAHCILKNFPRSLSPPGPRTMLTREEQYQCFNIPSSCGMLRTNRKRRNVSGGLNVTTVRNECKRTFQCLDDADMGFVFKLMDGTPCGRNKVCWNRKCVHSVN